MRIAVNTRLLLKGKLEGIGWYTHELLSRMVRNHPEHHFIFLFDRPFDPEFVFGPNVTAVAAGPPARHPVLFYTWFEVTVPRLLRKYKADVFLSPDGLSSLRTKVPTLLVMHDLAFEHYPEQLPLKHRLYLRRFSPRFAKKATKIITVSEFSKKDIAERYKISPDKIAVTYNGANPDYRPLSHQEREEIKQELTGGHEYFLFVGAIHPRKNVLNLLKAFILFKKRHRGNIRLVIVGRFAWKNEELAQLKDTMLFKTEVIWKGYLDVKMLSKVTGAAYATVYPSLFEGFGIPILEALQCEVPVICSNTSSMPEVGGDAALLVNPKDPQDIADKMGMLYKDEALRNKLVAASAAQAAKFSWDASAEILMQNIEEVATKKEGN